MSYEDLPHCLYCGYRHNDNKAHIGEQDSLGCTREMLKTLIDDMADTHNHYHKVKRCLEEVERAAEKDDLHSIKMALKTFFWKSK